MGLVESVARVRLRQSTLSAARAGTELPRYRRESCAVGIVHFGPGAFHRAHQAFYVDRLLGDDPRWGIAAVSLQSPATRDALAPQDGLYTLAEIGAQTAYRVIGSLLELRHAPQESAAVLARLTAPTTRIVTLTVTEKGYCLGTDSRLDPRHPDIAHDLGQPGSPRSVIGYLAEGLRRRRSLGIDPFAVVSCDNLPDNGATLRAAVTAFAERIDAGLAAWLAEQVAFPRTMVDSITPATDEAFRQRVLEFTGLEDAWPVRRESFTQWVIEDLPAVRVADWSAAGVTLARDVSLYDRAKLRLVNGAHSSLAYIGLLRGHETVAGAMSDRGLSEFVERLMRLDILPSLQGAPELDLDTYIPAVLERFRNPGTRHRLSQIAWDGSQKLPVRLMGTIEEAHRAGRPLHRLLLPVAAWMRFIARQAKAGVAIVDPLAEPLVAIGQACTGDAVADVASFVGLGAVLPQQLLAVREVRSALEQAYGLMGSPQDALPQ